MSRLEELLAELCPDGVNHYDLEEVCKFERGTSITSKSIINGTVPVIAGGQKPAYYHNKANRTGETIAIAGSGAYAGYVSYWDVPVFLSDSFSVNPNKFLIPKYVYYFLQSKQNMIYQTKKGGGVPHVHGSSIAKIKIPVPPIPIQDEIVRVLDSFTELTAELTAELTKRKEQYQYYKDALFSLGEDVEHIPLKNLAVNHDAKRRPIAKGKREAGIYPYYGASGVVDYVKNYIFDGDYLLVSEDGANLLARNTPIAFSITGKTWVNNHAHILQFSDINLQKYVEFYLNNTDLTKYISAAAQPKLTQENLNNILIPIPPLERIKRIVAILDRFDTLCNDLTSGLPAEIEARKKQYEYYRDKLLTFKEAV